MSMNLSSVSFPQPILSITNDDINSKISLNPQPLITSTSDSYKIVVNFDYDNKDLQTLVNQGDAEFFCEATCSDTLYRKIFTTTNTELQFEITKKSVKEKVSFTCLLVAREAIKNYHNSKSHPDFDGYFFDLEPGDILAYFGEFSFNADINYEKLKAISSFMEVVENTGDVLFTNIDLNKSKIEVQLPSQDYKLFVNDNISKEMKYAPVFHSSIVLNALMIALYNFESHKDFLWAKVIDYRLKNEEQFKNLGIGENENIPEIAQRLLGNPFRRLIAELQVISEFTSYNEED